MDATTVDGMRREPTGSIRAGESVTRQAERMLDMDRPLVRLPRHVRELRAAARSAIALDDRRIYAKAVARWESQLKRLGQGAAREAGEFTIRSATQQLVKDLGTAKIDRVDAIVERWVVEKARYQARMITRTESVEAYRQVYQQAEGGKPYTVGFRWVLSGAHPKSDVCDVFANQDLDGLGPGGYLPGNVPSNPHPHCLCQLVAIIDEQHFKRELAKLRGADEPAKPWLSGRTETGQEWVARQPEQRQRELLGPTRFDALKNGAAVIDEKGRPLPVHVVTGRPKPARELGPAIDATGAVRRDRQNQVQPFPRLRNAR